MLQLAKDIAKAIVQDWPGARSRRPARYHQPLRPAGNSFRWFHEDGPNPPVASLGGGSTGLGLIPLRFATSIAPVGFCPELAPIWGICRKFRAVDTTSVRSVSASSTSPTAPCPDCHQISNRLHSYSLRSPADLPLSGQSVRRFRCQNHKYGSRSYLGSDES